MVNKESKELIYQPEITIIVPVYHSQETLRECIRSIYESDYENDRIYVMVVDNGGDLESFLAFQACQEEFSDLHMNWLTSKQGKSKALNLALFNSAGRYVIHIDSDGVLHPKAIKRVVTYFEQEQEVHCITGTILTNQEMIEQTSSFGLRLLRRMEFFEYAQAFLAGRNFEAEFNSIYTVSGAFSAFRKSTILKTRLYNTDTVCEDTQITFQIREWMKQRIGICENAYFFVDPIEDVNRLYTQRQRWQRGELEVTHMFEKERKQGAHTSAEKKRGTIITRVLFYDHTFAFPRMIWYFAILCLLFLNYPIKLVVGSVFLLYVISVITASLYYFCILLYLRKDKNIQRYYRKLWYMNGLYPIYNFAIFWFRFAGIINAINGDQVWKTQTLTQEKEQWKQIVAKDFTRILHVLKKIRKRGNREEE